MKDFFEGPGFLISQSLLPFYQWEFGFGHRWNLKPELCWSSHWNHVSVKVNAKCIILVLLMKLLLWRLNKCVSWGRVFLRRAEMVCDSRGLNCLPWGEKQCNATYTDKCGLDKNIKSQFWQHLATLFYCLGFVKCCCFLCKVTACVFEKNLEYSQVTSQTASSSAF